jgi:hypothetical protein
MRIIRPAAALLLLTAFAAGAVQAEVVQQGTLRVAVSGTLSPKRLPRLGDAPIAVSVAGGIATDDGTMPPQLRSLRIELNRHGRLESDGLPRCRIDQIQPGSTARALEACRSALVGRGSFSIDVVLGTQVPYPTKGRLLIFNGAYRGRPALLGQIYSAHPFTNSFVIPFWISQATSGRYGTVLTAKLPPAFTSWGYVTGLELRLERRYSYRGRRRSIISAGCPVTKGSSVAVFPLARMTFAFAGGRRLSSTLTDHCSVRK